LSSVSGRAVAFLVTPASGSLSALLLKDIFTHYDPEAINPTVILHACKRSLSG
jgi:hypothetical protein